MLLRSLVLVVCMLGVAAPAATATLDDYLRAAQEHNHQLRLTRSALLEIEAQLGQARSRLLPSIVGGATYLRHEQAVEVPFSFDPTQPAQTVTITPRDQIDASATLNVPLIDMQSFALYSAARSRNERGAAMLAARQNDVALAVTRAFHDAIAATQVEEAARLSLETAVTTMALVQRRFELGVVAAIQLRRAEAEKARAEQTYAEAQAASSMTLRLLAHLTGSGERPTPPPARAARPAPNEEVLLASSRERNPEWRQAQAVRDEARAVKRSAWWEFAPTVAGTATERWSNATGFLGKKTSWELGGTLSWTLFDSWGRESRISEAQEREAQAIIRLEELEEQLAHRVQDTLAFLKAAELRLIAATAEVKAAREAERLSQEELKAGRATSLDVALSARDAFAAQVNLARAQSDVAVRSAELAHAAGEPLLSGVHAAQ